MRERLTSSPSAPVPAPAGRGRQRGLLRVLGALVPGRRAAGALLPVPGGDRAGSGRGSTARTRTRPPWWLIGFLACVVVPSAVAQVYLAVFAADQYVSEARLAVRQAEVSSGAGEALAGAASSGGAGLLAFNSASQDAYVVTSYLRSRAVVDDLSREIDLRSLFRRPEADLWARLRGDASIDDLVRYWNGMIFTYVDGPSGIVTLQVRAFRPEDAQALAQASLRLAERLVNTMSARARADALALAEAEVRRADGEWRGALAELRAFRDREGLIDPVKAADDTAKLIQGLLVDKIRMENELAVAAAGLAPDAPGLGPMRARLAKVDQQLRDLRGQLSGDGTAARNAAATLSRFEVIEIRRQFAEKLYALARDGLNRARTAAERRRIYLTVFAPPTLAQEAGYPRRLAYSLLIPAVLLVLWSIAAMVVLSVEDHRL